jgi:hypothetical protein
MLRLTPLAVADAQRMQPTVADAQAVAFVHLMQSTDVDVLPTPTVV